MPDTETTKRGYRTQNVIRLHKQLRDDTDFAWDVAELLARADLGDFCGDFSAALAAEENEVPGERHAGDLIGKLVELARRK